MNTFKLQCFAGLIVLAAATSNSQVPSLIRYQGRMVDGVTLISGDVEMVLRLYNAETSGRLEYEDSNTVTVVDGLYATFIGDDTLSGSLSSALTNAAVYLEVEVNGTILEPRERLASVGYALLAGGLTNRAVTTAMLADQAVTAGTLAAGAVTSPSIADGSVSNADLSVNAVSSGNIVDGTIQSSDVDAASFSRTFWKTDGNSNLVDGVNFLGTTDNRPMDIRVNNMRALRLEYIDYSGYDTFRIIGGHPANLISGGVASVISGGGVSMEPNIIYDDASVIAGGAGNVAGINASSDEDFAVISGGQGNRALENYATISGGKTNVVSGSYSTVGGGRNNRILAGYSSIGGGRDNVVSGLYSAVIGGYSNTAAGSNSVVLGGLQNTAGGNWSAAGGRRAKANHQGVFVWADSTDANFASTASNQFLVRASGGMGLNEDSPLAALHVNGKIIMGNGFTATSSNTNNLLNLLVGSSSNGAQNGITFWENTSGFGMSLGYDGSGSSSENAMHIYSDSDTALVRFENGGNVGIGTDNAGAVLDVYGGSSTIPVLNVLGDTETATSAGGADISIAAGSGGPGEGVAMAGSGGDISILAGSAGSGGTGNGGGNISIRGGRGAGFGSGGDIVIAGGFSFIPGNVLLAIATNGASSGNVGIRTEAPLAHLHVMGDDTVARLLLTPTEIVSGENAEIVMAEDHDGTYGMRILYDGSANQLQFYGFNDSATNGPHLIVARDTARVGIGTTNLNASYMLSVGGAIRATEVVVESGWADYVFEKNYPLRPIDEVENSILQNGHLPDMPPATRIQKEGVSLGEMQTLMMRKIEELTLYTIQQHRQIQKLQGDVLKLKEELGHD